MHLGVGRGKGRRSSGLGGGDFAGLYSCKKMHKLKTICSASIKLSKTKKNLCLIVKARDCLHKFWHFFRNIWAYAMVTQYLLNSLFRMPCWYIFYIELVEFWFSLFWKLQNLDPRTYPPTLGITPQPWRSATLPSWDGHLQKKYLRLRVAGRKKHILRRPEKIQISV